MAPSHHFFAAFLAGLVSFASPCVLPLIPAYLSFITGLSLDEMKTGTPRARLHTVLHTLAFCCGFSFVFIAAGLTAGSVGAALDKVWLARIGGVITILLGLQMLGVFRLPQLMVDRRLKLARSGARGYLTSVLVGVGFAAGWSPCIGPILSGIMLLASEESTARAGGLLLATYSLGLSVPFLITALAFGNALRLIIKVRGFVRVIEIVAGTLLIAIGIGLLNGGFARMIGVLGQSIGKQ